MFTLFHRPGRRTRKPRIQPDPFFADPAAVEDDYLRMTRARHTATRG